MKSTSRDAGERARRVTAQAVGDEPLLSEKVLRVMSLGPFMRGSFYSSPFLLRDVQFSVDEREALECGVKTARTPKAVADFDV